MTSQGQDLRMVAFTCPTCGQDKCQIVFSHSFDPKAPGAVLGFTHDDGKGENDPLKYIECGLRANLENVGEISRFIKRGKDVPKSLVVIAARGKTT